MQQENQRLVLNATELPWLDVTYTAKKYLQDEQYHNTPAKPKRGWVKRALSFGAVATACLAIMLGFTFVNGSFDGNFLQVAKATVTSTVFNPQKDVSTTLSVPCNMQVDSVSDGVIVLSGGKALTSLTTGTVVECSQNTVTIQMDDNTIVLYDGVVDCFVSTGDVVQKNQLLGKYNGSVCVSVLFNGQVVVDVVASPNAIKWSI